MGSSGFVGVVAIIEAIKEHHARHNFADCMKAKGWVCTSNCPDSSNEQVETKVEPKSPSVDEGNQAIRPAQDGVLQPVQRSTNTKALEWLAKSKDSFEQREWTEVIRTASAAILLDAGIEAAYLNRAWAYYQKGFTDEALKDCDKAAEINPKNPLAYNYRALIYSKQNHMDEALQEIDKAFQIDDKNPLTYNNRGVIYQKRGETARARADYKTACEYQYSLGCENYKTMTGFYPADIPRIVNQLIDESNQYFQKKDWDGVILKTSEALKYDASNVTAYVNRAGAYANMKMLREASEDCDTAIKINPDYGLAYNNRGYVYELLGQIKQAKLDYDIGCNLGIRKACENLKRIGEIK